MKKIILRSVLLALLMLALVTACVNAAILEVIEPERAGPYATDPLVVGRSHAERAEAAQMLSLATAMKILGGDFVSTLWLTSLWQETLAPDQLTKQNFVERVLSAVNDKVIPVVTVRHQDNKFNCEDAGESRCGSRRTYGWAWSG